MPDPDAPKIIVDSDWKSQARAEKERLSGGPKPEPAARPGAPSPASGASPSGAGSPPPGGPTPRPAPTGPAATAGPDLPPAPAPAPGQQALPPADFEELVRTLATQALMYLGGMEDPQTGRAVVALDVARLYVDLLAVLQEKTNGNLSTQEMSLLSGVLYELRMRYIEIAKAIEKAASEGRIGPGGVLKPPARQA